MKKRLATSWLALPVKFLVANGKLPNASGSKWTLPRFCGLLRSASDLARDAEFICVRAGDLNNDVALGSSQLDLPAILIAAKKESVQHHYIKNESTHTATLVPSSIAYRKSLTK
jgi:hypothetical protein